MCQIKSCFIKYLEILNKSHVPLYNGYSPNDFHLRGFPCICLCDSTCVADTVNDRNYVGEKVDCLQTRAERRLKSDLQTFITKIQQMFKPLNIIKYLKVTRHLIRKA